MNFQKDYYKILGIEETATETDIKLAYRRMVYRYHPDRNPNNPEYEDLIKEINEAKEVLLNMHNRYAYNEYRKTFQKEKIKAEKSEEGPAQESTVIRRTVVKEKRIYITGDIFIKYAAPKDKDQFDPSLRESCYIIHTKEVKAEISKSDCIWSEITPNSFIDIFENCPVFPAKVPQPITTLVRDHEKETHYSLYIHQLRIPNPALIWVTKHENLSYGTITGKFYGYTKKFEEEEIAETINEKKEDHDSNYQKASTNTEEKTKTDDIFRKKYDPFYGERNQTYSSRHYPNRTQKPYEHTSDGCLGTGIGIFAWILIAIWIIIQVSYILPLIICYVVLIFLINFLNGPQKKSFPVIGPLFVSLTLIGLIWFLSSQYSRNRSVLPQLTESQGESIPNKWEIIKDSSIDNKQPDTIITVFREWRDYNNHLYSGTYTYKASQLIASHDFKQNFPENNTTPANYDYIIYSIKENNEPYLSGIYKLFDSLLITHNLSRKSFAEMIMSFIQDMPYSIILNGPCDASQYRDAFIDKYLSSPNALCEPFQRFGIYTPIEFISHKNGDCDTRTLFAYMVLAHYKYDVALLSSEKYKHSLLAINLPYPGIFYRLRQNRYVVWETTAFLSKPGVISEEISNMNNWRISLVNQPFIQ